MDFTPSLDVEGWPGDLAICRCDEDFVEWLIGQPKPIDKVLHMGTGLHHRVGLYCTSEEIECIGITVSRAEQDAWFEMFRRDMSLSGYYNVVLSDIYTYELPTDLSVMSLFHLGELVYLFGPLPVERCMEIFRSVKRGGYVLFYTGSSAWDRTSQVVQLAAARGIFKKVETYKQLEIYQR